MRSAAFAALALLALEAGAQTYKCQDDQRRITYSNMPCEKQGLKDAGPVAERLMTVPATVPPKAAPKKEPTAKGEAPQAEKSAK